ncbi:MAG: fumarate hydratase C-terminal domain-containing protein [Candidatus Wallbacteria bacterium]|nr:fumarate hydratase C-terminal domain-containing protein [Candidatus Wallbacteria bacterium]
MKVDQCNDLSDSSQEVSCVSSGGHSVVTSCNHCILSSALNAFASRSGGVLPKAWISGTPPIASTGSAGPSVSVVFNPAELIRRIGQMKSGDRIAYSGVLYTLRDASLRAFQAAGGLPVELQGKIAYFCGPSGNAASGRAGACGPTTSRRFDRYQEFFEENGVMVTIGKGRRSDQVAADCAAGKHFYFVTYGGLGALLGSFVTECRTAFLPELGPEAVYCLSVRGFPLMLAYDRNGGSLF